MDGRNLINKTMHIHIINWENGMNNGILSKFANRMFDNLKAQGANVTMSGQPDLTADLNHHVNYLPYKYNQDYKGKTSLMITHIFDGYKRDAITEQMKTADYGICMSDDTKKQLIEWGLPVEKLFTVLPAHDSIPRRHQVVSVLTNVYPDGCKREGMFTELARTLDNNKWAFRIMGSGWSDILTPLVASGLQVDYFAEFNLDYYKKILESSDYFLYLGVDEGSMGLLDAKQAGMRLIAPKVGFNIDIGVDYAFKDQKQLNAIFKRLGKNKVEKWNWTNYVKNHIKIWEKLPN